jgi:hypothetical protein
MLYQGLGQLATARLERTAAYGVVLARPIFDNGRDRTAGHDENLGCAQQAPCRVLQMYNNDY